MTERVFVDTNILLYARDAAEPAKRAVAATLIAQLWRERTGRTSVQVLSEYYVNATRKLKPGLEADDAWDDVHAFFAWRPQPIDVPLLAAGRDIERRYRVSWWDSLVVAAAQAQRCAILLSEDFQHGMAFGGVIVRDPFRPQAEETVASYRGGVGTVVRHPARGRPKRG